MSDFLDPKKMGLPSRTVIEKLSDDTLALVVDRKSRIIMSDGKKILDKVQIIKVVQSGKNIVLKTSAPVCSKTIQFLNEHDNFKRGIDRLTKGGQDGWLIALMCAEEDPLHCHRSVLIARQLEVNRTVPVLHLRSDGSQIRAKRHLPEQPQQLTLF